jgi:hypothetical protein
MHNKVALTREFGAARLFDSANREAINSPARSRYVWQGMHRTLAARPSAPSLQHLGC